MVVDECGQPMTVVYDENGYIVCLKCHAVLHSATEILGHRCGEIAAATHEVVKGN